MRVDLVESAKRILVVAPHPDDDVIGCGGLMSKCSKLGSAIQAIYVTDGSASHPRSKLFPPSVLRILRENEARAALDELSIDEAPVFLGARDGKLNKLRRTERRSLIAQIAITITSFKPDLILTPWRADPHPDHIASTRLVEQALRRTESLHRAEMLMYTVWLGARKDSDLVLDKDIEQITITLDEYDLARKRRAILAHQSQVSALITDDPKGFRIDEYLLEFWTKSSESFYRPQNGYKL